MFGRRNAGRRGQGSGDGGNGGGTGSGAIPQELSEIPSGYYAEAEERGTLVELYYDTYESFSYEEGTQPLKKRAIVYLPYGYSEEKNGGFGLAVNFWAENR